MKLSYLFIFSFCVLSSRLVSQSHQTIESVSVNYRASSLVDTSGTGIINVFPEAVIKLFTADSIAKIHCKIINPVDQTILYNVDYVLNAGNVIDGTGKILFSKVDSTLYINGATVLSLTPYSYELTTEDNEGNLSSLFSEIH